MLSRHRPIATRKPTQASSAPRILVLDDERNVADSVAFMLEHEGYRVKVSYSGADAIAIAREFKPMLVLADVVMPGMNGVEAATKICHDLPSCRAILFSGHAEGRQLCLDAQSKGQLFEFIEKPTHPTEILSKIRFALY